MAILISAPIEGADYALLWTDEETDEAFEALNHFASRKGMGNRVIDAHIRAHHPFWGLGGVEVYHFRIEERFRKRAVGRGAVETDFREWMLKRIQDENEGVVKL